MVVYYRQFVQNFCYQNRNTHQPNKERPTQKHRMDRETETGYKTLKHDLSHSVIPKNPDFIQTFQLQTDASDVGVGAILSQGGNKINLLPVLAGSYYITRRSVPQSKKNA